MFISPHSSCPRPEVEPATQCSAGQSTSNYAVVACFIIIRQAITSDKTSLDKCTKVCLMLLLPMTISTSCKGSIDNSLRTAQLLFICCTSFCMSIPCKAWQLVLCKYYSSVKLPMFMIPQWEVNLPSRTVNCKCLNICRRHNFIVKCINVCLCFSTWKGLESVLEVFNAGLHFIGKLIMSMFLAVK